MGARVIDCEGYRPNVGIILTNEQGRLFWARRVGQNSWQFPQGGINEKESTEEAMFRELNEETGLLPEHVEIIGATRHWLKYDLPSRYIRRHCRPLCIGQKQIWFMLRLVGDDDCVDLSCCDKPEFDEWCWVDYWHPMSQVIFFKRQVYHQALKELAPLLSPDECSNRRSC